jgi:hypothetical protein
MPRKSTRHDARKRTARIIDTSLRNPPPCAIMLRRNRSYLGRRSLREDAMTHQVGCRGIGWSGLTTAIFLTMTAWLAATAMVGADPITDCNQEADQQRRITGCTALIDSARLAGNDLAAAFFLRGTAHEKTGDLVRAVGDFRQARKSRPDWNPPIAGEILAINTLNGQCRDARDAKKQADACSAVKSLGPIAK